MAAIRIGSGASDTSTSARPEPETSDATSSAAAAPAPMPMSTICTIRCPARGAVRDGSWMSAPTWRRIKPIRRPCAAFWSADQVGQKAEEPRPFDGAGEFALLLRRHGRDPARNDLAALGDVMLQQLDVLVVDLGGVGAGERTDLAAAEERPTGRQLRKAHGLLLRRRLGFVALVAAPASLALAAALAAALLAIAVAVGLAHHGRRPGLVLVDAHREVAQDILVEALLPFDLGKRRRGRVHVHEGEMRLAVLAQAVAERLEAPVLGFADGAAHLFNDSLELGG